QPKESGQQARPEKPAESKQEPTKPAEPAKPEPKPSDEDKPAAPHSGVKLLLFNRWDTSQVRVNDAGLKNYINLNCMPVPRTGGKYGSGGFQKNKMPIVERFMNKLWVSGHRGKKHKLTSGPNVGKTPMLYRNMKQAFEIIEKRTNQNPVQVLVGAIENSAVLEEVASYRLGGIIARNSVISSPQRRLDLALRHLTQGIHRSSFRNKLSLAGVIANDLIAAYNNDSKSFAVSEKKRMEKEAEGAR
ncbi:MAG: hypothetical protein KAT35_05460, partial [Candidatus Aenigmarchaeota archaeon]|nr:hypothetical protein [Candidatus Aenigmarchaeota archaeon]